MTDLSSTVINSKNRIIGHHIRWARRDKMKQASALAEVLGISQEEYLEAESGKQCFSKEQLELIADTLDVALDSLLEKTQEDIQILPEEAKRLVHDFSKITAPEIRQLVLAQIRLAAENHDNRPIICQPD